MLEAVYSSLLKSVCCHTNSDYSNVNVLHIITIFNLYKEPVHEAVKSLISNLLQTRVLCSEGEEE